MYLIKLAVVHDVIMGDFMKTKSSCCSFLHFHEHLLLMPVLNYWLSDMLGNINK